MNFAAMLLKATHNTREMQQTFTDLVQDHAMETEKCNAIVKKLEAEINACSVKFNLEAILNPWIMVEQGQIQKLKSFLEDKDDYIKSKYSL